MMASARTPTFSEMAPELEQYSVLSESSRLHMLDNLGLLAPASALCFMPSNILRIITKSPGSNNRSKTTHGDAHS
jgi:hypothetical protein